MNKVDCFSYLIPEYASYRVPVFERLFDILGNGFSIVTLPTKCRSTSSTIVALEKGDFCKHEIPGIVVKFNKAFKEGRGTPSRLLINPSLPFLLPKLKAQVIMSEGFSAWTLTSILMGYPTVVFWEGGNEFTERTVKPWKTALRKWMVKRVKSFVTNGYLSKKYLVDTLGAPEERVFVGGMCSQPINYQSKSERNIYASKIECINFIFCGSLINRKGVQHLIRSVAFLKQRENLKNKFQVFILGEGEGKKEFESLSKTLDVENLVNFVGFVRPEQIWDYYAKSHVFVLPTLHDNWPLVIPEAMYMGLPVLASKYAGNVPDLVQDGKNGFIFDPHNHEELSSFMAFYINNSHLIEEHGNNSLEIVKPFNPETAAQKILYAVQLAFECN